MKSILKSLAGLCACALVLTGCSGDDARANAVENLRGVLGVDEVTANCIIDEFGEARLGEIGDFDPESTEAPSEAIDDAADAVATCMIGALSTEPSDPASGAQVAPDEESEVDCATAEVEGACDYGDDAELDGLWDQCDEGDMAACDDLYFASPTGSRYEQFGNRCGDRGFALICSEAGE